MITVHAAIEGLVDRYQQWREYREAVRRQRWLRRNRVMYIGVRPDPKCIVHNERDITR